MKDNYREDRNSSDELMLFGIRPVIEAIDAGREVERIFIQKDLNSPIAKELKTLLSANGIQFTAVPVEKLNRLTRKNHQGVVCFLSHISYIKVEDLVPALFEKPVDPLLLLLDRITDVRNFGAICRSAECLGVDAVVIPDRGGALVNGDAVKASAGALNRIPVCREVNLKNTIDYLKNSGYRILGCTEKGTSNISQVAMDGPVCIIMGSEEDGISPEYLKRCDHLVKIPLHGKTLSLNVSVAAGIILYEVTRQRNV